MATWGDEPQGGQHGQPDTQGPPPDLHPAWQSPPPPQPQEPAAAPPAYGPPPSPPPPPWQQPPAPPQQQQWPPPNQQQQQQQQQQWQAPPAPPNANWQPGQAVWAPTPTGVPPAPPAPPAPPRKTSIGPALMVIALLVAATGATYWFVTREDGPSYPEHWDERVTDLVAFVEEERLLRFEHPVEVTFLDDAAWKEEMTTDPGSVTDEAREEADLALGVLRAMGLVSGDVDLFEETDELAVSDVLAFYDYENESITVHADPDEELSVGVRGTLVHELTHVIQDQHYDLTAMSESVDDDSIVFDALTEGDATNVEQAWYDDLSDEDKAAYDAEQDAVGEAAEAVDVPDALRTLMGVPYALGPPFAGAIAAQGRTELKDAFQDPPSDDEAVFSPQHYIAGDTRELVSKPETPEDAEENDEGQFGPVTWYIMLSERIDAHQAFTAMRGFGGDYYSQYELDGKQCMRVRYKGESELETAAMKSALDAWIASLPTPFASVTDEGDTLLFESCDPGGDVDLATGKSQGALLLPVLHSYAVSAVLGEGRSMKVAECYANGIVDRIPEESLSIDEEPAGMDAIVEEAARECF
jgi:hypothetical protein